MLSRIEKFGVHAVMGRPVLYEREMRRMITARNIVNAYKDRAASTSWDSWVKENEAMANLLHKAQRLFEDVPTR